MAASSSALLIEDDDGPGNDGLAGPGAPATLQVPEDDFEIIDAGDDGQPLPGNAGGGEARLDEGAAGDRPLLEQQGRVDPATGKPRLSNRDRRAAQRAARERVYSENADLRAALQKQGEEIAQIRGWQGGVDQTMVAGQHRAIDQEIATASSEFRASQAAMAQTLARVTGGEATPEDFVKAIEVRDKAFLREQYAKNQKAQLPPLQAGQADGQAQPTAPRQQQPNPQQQAPTLPPQALALVEEFAEEHPWFNVNGADADSTILRSLDAAVTARGFDPSTDAYFDELRRLGRAALPHRFADDGQAAPQRGNGRQANGAQRRGPMTGPVGDRPNAPLGRNQVKLTPGRKSALAEIGATNPDGSIADRPKYLRMLKQYADYDRAEGAAR